jgi:pseudomonalisin
VIRTLLQSHRLHISIATACVAGMALAALPRAAWPAAGPAPAPAAVARIVEPIDDAARVMLRGHLHPALRESEDLGLADPRQRAERVLMVLRGSPAQEADLEQRLRDIQTRGNAAYHQWLTPKSFGRRFGAAAEDIAKVRAWLESRGFHVDDEPAGGRSIIFSGTLADLNAAFAVRIHNFRWRGESHVASAIEPSIPKALSPVVRGLASLSDFRHRPLSVRSGLAPYTNLTGGAHGLSPGDFATIYDLNAPFAQGIRGTGRSIAVLGRSNVLPADISTFHATFMLPGTLPAVIVNGADPGRVHGDELESDLDLEWADAVAPSAAVTLVTTQSTALTDGIDLSAQYAVSNNVADILSLSYGSCEAPGDVSAGTTHFHQLWQQAAAQGISVFVAAGDSGAAGCDLPSSATATHGPGVNRLCSSPHSTCVGGTQFTADVANPANYWAATNSSNLASALSYIGEAVWNESGTNGGKNLWASGGGASTYFAKPAWQLATGVPSDAQRDVPDVALAAAAGHDPYLIYTSDGYPPTSLVGIGGTSAAAPSLAGIAALVAQAQGGRLGNLNPTLYGLSERQAAGGAAVFHRITSGNNSVPGQAGFFASVSSPTYSEATGLGSVDGAQLIAHWSDLLPPPSGLSPLAAVLPAAASVGIATLTVPATMSWNAVASAGWLSVTPTSGAGNQSLTYVAAANQTGNPRGATIAVAGQVLTLTQAPAAGSGSNTSQLSVSASSLNFGTDPIGIATTAQRLLVSDTGSAALTLGAITVTGAAAADFTDSGSCVSGLVLAPGASCYLDVRFGATAGGARSATLQISIGGGGTVTVALSGSGGIAPNGGDGPLPPWALALLAAGLVAIARRRLAFLPTRR